MVPEVPVHLESRKLADLDRLPIEQVAEYPIEFSHLSSQVFHTTIKVNENEAKIEETGDEQLQIQTFTKVACKFKKKEEESGTNKKKCQMFARILNVSKI